MLYFLFLKAQNQTWNPCKTQARGMGRDCLSAGMRSRRRRNRRPKRAHLSQIYRRSRSAELLSRWHARPEHQHRHRRHRSTRLEFLEFKYSDTRRQRPALVTYQYSSQRGTVQPLSGRPIGRHWRSA